MQKITNFAQLMMLAASQSNGTGGRYAGILGDDSLSGGGMVRAYTGAGDPSINISGTIQDFRQEGDINKRFAFTLKNSAATPLTVRLFAGYDTLADGVMKDGAFNDVTGAPGLTATANNPRSSILGFQGYVLRNPTRVVAMRLQTDITTQFEQEFSIGRLDPFQQTGSIQLNPSLNINSTTFNDKVVTMNTDGLQLDDRSDLLYTVDAGVTISIVLFCGASYESSQALAVKAAVAQGAVQNNARVLAIS